MLTRYWQFTGLLVSLSSCQSSLKTRSINQDQEKKKKGGAVVSEPWGPELELLWTNLERCCRLTARRPEHFQKLRINKMYYYYILVAMVLMRLGAIKTITMLMWIRL